MKGQVQYINILGGMIYNLKLSGNELLLYALIFGYTQDGKNQYHGSLTYIQNGLQLSRPSVISLLKKLQKKGYIIKIKESYYIVSKESLLLVASKESLPLDSKESLPLDSKESLPNINNTNNNYNNNILSKDNTETSSEIVVDKRDFEIDLIIETLKEINSGIIDDTKVKQRRYGKLIKNKMNDIKGFDGRYVDFINMLYENSDEYKKNHFRSAEKFFYNLASIISGIKVKIEKKNIGITCV